MTTILSFNSGMKYIRIKCYITSTYYIGTPPYFTIHPANKVVDLYVNATNASLNCQADGALSYDWEKRDDRNFSSSIGINSPILTLTNLQPQDASYYRCKATNISASSYSEFAVLSIFG